MSDETSRNSEGYLKEVEEGRVLHNLRLLELKFTDQEAQIIDKQTRNNLLAIQQKETRLVKNGFESGIFIFYNTETGVIGWPEGTFLGDYSVIKTVLVEKEEQMVSTSGETALKRRETREILLYRPADFPSGAQYSAAVMGET